jgi:predicted dehydrogenase
MNKIILVGAGNIAGEYASILKLLKVEFETVCVTKKSAESFSLKWQVPCRYGGINKDYHNSKMFNKAIIAVNIDQLFSVCNALIDAGIKYILIEKPGAINFIQIKELGNLSNKTKTNIFIAYNRRNYASVLKCKEFINEDGGVLSCHFEFTEWSHIIEKINSSEEIKSNWLLANSSHVIDLAFHLIGKPKEMNNVSNGEISWHKPSCFAGSGVTVQNVIFSYHANWESPGRWGIEINTKKRKLILKPLEKLFVQEIGKIETNEVPEIDFYTELNFKPGYYVQTENFVKNNFEKLKSLSEQVKDIDIYKMILGNKK